ncbi:MAG: hypothetical protein J5818_04905 [Eggerthellaceae bacterium]|nr:hypothetical protein [Eggerthellaceae bacterium]
MHVEAHDLEMLLDLQKVDLEILQAKKKRSELPQRAQLATLKAKRDKFIEKRDQVVALKDKAEADMAAVEAEDSQLAEKQQRAQELIDAAGSDYRSIESHSKELSGFAKRRDTLSGKIDVLGAQLKKIDDMLAQLNQGLGVVEREQKSVRDAFFAQDSQLEQVISGLMEQRATMVGQLPADVVALYEKTAAKTGGVAIGHLVDESCGVCRSAIEGGRLIELHAAAPLGVCPSCKRLLVIE